MAAYEQPGLFISQTAGQDFVLADRYKVVRSTATGVKVGAAATGVPAGVLYSMSKTGTAVKVMHSGIAMAKVGEAVVKGDRVTADATGALVKVVTTEGSATAEAQVVGVMQEAASAGSIGAVLLTL